MEGAETEENISIIMEADFFGQIWQDNDTGNLVQPSWLSVMQRCSSTKLRIAGLRNGTDQNSEDKLSIVYSSTNIVVRLKILFSNLWIKSQSHPM